MKLFNATLADNSNVVGLWHDDHAHNLSAYWHATDNPLRHAGRSTDSLLAHAESKGLSLSELISGVKPGDAPLLEDFTWQTPVRRPRKIIALVRNYRKHAEEFGAAPPPAMRWFAKFPSTMLPHQGELVLPEWLKGRVDHEVELGVVIGKKARNVSEADAMDFVAGYTILNDVSARGVQKILREETMPWLPAKNLEGFCPSGAFLTTTDAIKDAQNLRVTCHVNGELRQDGNSEEMLHPVASTIAQLSQWLTLECGDIIATGTPAGVGPLEDGDRVECVIEEVGFLHHSVRSCR